MRVVKVTHGLGNKFLDFFGSPAKAIGQNFNRKAKQVICDIFLEQCPHCLFSPSFGPWTERKFGVGFLNRFEAMLLQELSESGRGHGVDTQFFESLVHTQTPLCDCGVGAGATVIATNGNVEFLKLDPAPRAKAGKGLLDEIIPVPNAQKHGTCVDQIKALAESPLGLGIINKELAVCGDVVGLNG